MYIYIDNVWMYIWYLYIYMYTFDIYIHVYIWYIYIYLYINDIHMIHIYIFTFDIYIYIQTICICIYIYMHIGRNMLSWFISGDWEIVHFYVGLPKGIPLFFLGSLCCRTPYNTKQKSGAITTQSNTDGAGG